MGQVKFFDYYTCLEVSIYSIPYSLAPFSLCHFCLCLYLFILFFIILNVSMKLKVFLNDIFISCVLLIFTLQYWPFFIFLLLYPFSCQIAPLWCSNFMMGGQICLMLQTLRNWNSSVTSLTGIYTGIESWWNMTKQKLVHVNNKGQGFNRRWSFCGDGPQNRQKPLFPLLTKNPSK